MKMTNFAKNVMLYLGKLNEEEEEVEETEASCKTKDCVNCAADTEEKVCCVCGGKGTKKVGPEYTSSLSRVAKAKGLKFKQTGFVCKGCDDEAREFESKLACTKTNCSVYDGVSHKVEGPDKDGTPNDKTSGRLGSCKTKDKCPKCGKKKCECSCKTLKESVLEYVNL